MNAGVWDQVGLELVQIDIESTVETQGRCDGADNLGDQAIEVFVRGAGNVKVAAADVVDRLVVDKKSAIRVLNSAVSGQYSIIRFDNGGVSSRRRIDGKFELSFLAKLGGKTFKHQSAETRAGTTAKRVKHQESLQGVAIV